MRFKEERMRHELKAAPDLLRRMVFDFEWISLQEAGEEPVVTSVYREDGSTHNIWPPLRIDFRDEHGGQRKYTEKQVDRILARFNRKYPRNDRYLSLIHHKRPGGVLHFHMQMSAVPSVYEIKEELNV